MTEYDIQCLLSWLSDGTLFDMRDQFKRGVTYTSIPEMKEQLQRYLDCIDNVFVARERIEQEMRRDAERQAEGLDDFLNKTGPWSD